MGTRAVSEAWGAAGRVSANGIRGTPGGRSMLAVVTDEEIEALLGTAPVCEPAGRADGLIKVSRARTWRCTKGGRS
jgi:hypothetical protein